MLATGYNHQDDGTLQWKVRLKLIMLCNAFPMNIIGVGEYVAHSLACAMAKRVSK
jgi:hypothetical protein